MADLGVIYIVYAPYGPALPAEFLRSYRQHPAGIDHELILLCKGFEAGALPDGYRALLKDLPHRCLIAPADGFDLGSYLFAARACEHRRLCCLNSSSVILDRGWLAKLCAAQDPSEVGIAGASGTFESRATSLRRYLPRATGRNRRQLFFHRMRNRYSLCKAAIDFPAFPNPHLRTNAMVIERHLLLALRAGPFRNKEDCYRFESGRRGLTQQILSRGLSVLVVGRDGRSYGVSEWPQSETFRHGEQSNLLVADNQTRQYLAANASERALLARFAWGVR